MSNKRNYRKYNDDDIINYAKEVKSIAGLLKKLGIVPRGGNYKCIKAHLSRLGVDCSHWTGQGWNKGVMSKNWGQYAKASAIKPHLINFRGHKCENCQQSEWMGKKIPLEIEHCDGDSTNNSLSNLKLFCCNCHALTPTWRRRKDALPILDLEQEETDTHKEEDLKLKQIINGKGKTTHNKIPKKSKNKYPTLEEARKSLVKGNYPTNDQLLLKVWETPIFKLAHEIGVSDNGIRHYCKRRNIPTPPPGYWNKLTAGKLSECDLIKSKIFENWEGIKDVDYSNNSKK